MAQNEIHATNKRRLNHKIALVSETLQNLDSYGTWWSGAKFTTLDETTLEVSPLGPGKFTLTLLPSSSEDTIIFAYEGIFSGEGIWTMESKSAQTLLIYSVNLTINHPFYTFINKFISIEKMHKNMMEKVFTTLDIYLNNHHASA